MADSVELYREKFTLRLEAFSDLVFGFSLSLLATRLDVPAKVEDIYDPTRRFAVRGADISSLPPPAPGRCTLPRRFCCDYFCSDNSTSARSAPASKRSESRPTPARLAALATPIRHQYSAGFAPPRVGAARREFRRGDARFGYLYRPCVRRHGGAVPAPGSRLAQFPCLTADLAISPAAYALRHKRRLFALLMRSLSGKWKRRFSWAGANFPEFSCGNLEQFGVPHVQCAVKSKARLKGTTVTRNTAQARAVEEEPELDPELDAELAHRPGVGTLARTKSLILAAVRVWELKRGLRR